MNYPTIDQLKDSKYLKKEDFPKPMLLTIRDFQMENVALPSKPKQDKGVLYFNELQKGMVLNSTNAKLAANALGSKSIGDWIGKQIVAYNNPNVEFGGELIGGIRLRPVKEPVKPDPMDGLEDDIPFN